MDTTTILIIIVAVIIIFVMAIAVEKMNTAKPNNENDKTRSINEPMPYKLVESIFTKSEQKLFEILRNYCRDKDLLIFSKVRLADVVKIENKSSNFQYWFNKIRSKHVDFLICESESGKPKLAIELDDYTHNQKNRRERDEFVDQVYGSIELPILHITELNEEKINQEVSKLI